MAGMPIGEHGRPANIFLIRLRRFVVQCARTSRRLCFLLSFAGGKINRNPLGWVSAEKTFTMERSGRHDVAF